MDFQKRAASLSQESQESLQSEASLHDNVFSKPIYESPIRCRQQQLPVPKTRTTAGTKEGTPRKENSQMWIDDETQAKAPIPTPRKLTLKPSSSMYDSVKEKSPSPSSSLRSNRTSNISTVHELRDTEDDDNEEEADEQDKLESIVNPRSPVSTEQLGVVIHRLSDPLIVKDSLVLHPAVLVHVVDLETGDYLIDKCSESKSCLRTLAFDVKAKKSFQPIWEELLSFDASSQLALESSILILFEVVDLPNAAVSNENAKKVAWGFLKFERSRTKTRELIGKKVRVQLFHTSRRKFTRPKNLEAYIWWKSGQRQQIASTLFVTVKSVRKCEFSSPSHPENLSSPSTHNTKSLNQTFSLPPSPVKWRRFPGQSCKVPSRKKTVLETEIGALIVKFSPDGLKLACGVIGGKIAIFHVLTEETIYLEGHLGHVYDMDWYESVLLSAGADDSVRLWEGDSSQVLTHPAYVYACRFISRGFVITGCYDFALRVWSVGDGESAKLIATYLEHVSPINALCVCKTDQLVITGDCQGEVKLWKIRHEKVDCGLTCDKSMETLDVRNAVVTSLCTDSRERSLIMRTKDSKIRVVDIRTGLVLNVISEIENTKYRLGGAVTPCGSFIIAGDEDGVVRMWNLTSGTLAAMISIKNSVPVTAVDYHPLDHILAVATLEQILIYDFDKNSQQTPGIVVVPTTVLAVGEKPSPSHSIKEKFMLEDNYPESRSKLAQIHPARSSPAALQKLERIFAKLDVVLEWEQQSVSNMTSRASYRGRIGLDSSRSAGSKSPNMEINPALVETSSPLSRVVTVRADVHENCASQKLPVIPKRDEDWDADESC